MLFYQFYTNRFEIYGISSPLWSTRCCLNRYFDPTLQLYAKVKKGGGRFHRIGDEMARSYNPAIILLRQSLLNILGLCKNFFFTSEGIPETEMDNLSFPN